MMKTVFSRMAGQGAQSRVALRHFSSTGTLGCLTEKLGGKWILQTKGGLPMGTPAATVQRMTGGVRANHGQKTKRDEELINFLEEEIATEMKALSSTSVPTNFEGFQVSGDKSEIVLVKKVGNEEIRISANVNHSVDQDTYDESAMKKPEGEDNMRSRPNFDIEIKRGSQILRFQCSFFVREEGEPENTDKNVDIFAIDEVTMFEGEGNETDYAVAGDILDGYLYHLFMNWLEERGVTNEFVQKLSDLFTNYEHKLYVELMAKLQNFLANK